MENKFELTFDENNQATITEAMVIDIFSAAVAKLTKIDQLLFKHQVQERAIAARLAMYLRDTLIAWELETQKPQILVDDEYNKDGDDFKSRDFEIYNRVKAGKRPYIIPDILIHERGSGSYTGNDRYRNDLVYCEIKKESKSQADDAGKVCQQLLVRKYQYGVDMYCVSKSKIEMDVYNYNKADDQFIKTPCYFDFDQNAFVPGSPVKLNYNRTGHLLHLINN